MKIDNHPVARAAQLYRQQRAKEAAGQKRDPKVGEDRVTLSSAGRELQNVMQKVQATPDIRPQAEELKQAVKTGTYNVSGRAIAESILKTLEQ